MTKIAQDKGEGLSSPASTIDGERNLDFVAKFYLKYRNLGFKLQLLILLLFSVLVAEFVGYVQRDASFDSLGLTIEWIANYPVQFAANAVIIFIVSVPVLLATKRLYAAVLFGGAIAWTISAVNYFKMATRNEPFYPTDLSLVTQAMGILGDTTLNWPASLWLFALFIIATAILTAFIKNFEIRKKIRLILLAVSLLAVFAMYPLYLANTNAQKMIGVTNEKWNQLFNYHINGPVHAFFMQLEYVYVAKPSGYSKDWVTAELDGVVAGKVAQDTKPDIIYMLGESFWDPRQLPGVEYNINPLGSIEKLSPELIRGELAVTPFGGNTANTEFEVLTGFSMEFLPPGSSAYSNYYSRALPSLPLQLKDSGYSTSAIHSFIPEFWSRSRVYEHMGFDKFITSSSFDAEKDTKGKFLSEDAVANMVIKDYEANKKTNKPYFAHVVTMQNHASYDAGRYGEDQQVRVSSGQLSEENKHIVEIYAQGVKDSSDAFVKLVEYFKAREKPVVIVFYGDHLAALGDNKSVYQQTGFIKNGAGLSEAEEFKMRRTPLYIWNSENKQAKDIGIMNSFYLTPFVLDEIGAPMSPYFNYLNQNKNKAKACLNTLCLNENGEYVDRQDDVFQQYYLDRRKIQYYYMID